MLRFERAIYCNHVIEYATGQHRYDQCPFRKSHTIKHTLLSSISSTAFVEANEKAPTGTNSIPMCLDKRASTLRFVLRLLLMHMLILQSIGLVYRRKNPIYFLTYITYFYSSSTKYLVFLDKMLKTKYFSNRTRTIFLRHYLLDRVNAFYNELLFVFLPPYGIAPFPSPSTS